MDASITLTVECKALLTCGMEAISLYQLNLGWTIRPASYTTGTYSQQNGFTMKLGPAALAACGEGSLSQQYLNLLSNVAAGGPDGTGGLTLETAGRAQRRLFINGGAVPP